MNTHAFFTDPEPKAMTFYLEGDADRPQVIRIFDMDQNDRLLIKLCDRLILEKGGQVVADLYAAPGPLPSPCSEVRITQS